MTPKSIIGKRRRSIWTLSTNNDSARNPFRLVPGDSRNHSGGIWIPFEIPSESFDQFGRPLCQIWFLWNSGNCPDSAGFRPESVEDNKDLRISTKDIIVWWMLITLFNMSSFLGLPFWISYYFLTDSFVWKYSLDSKNSIQHHHYQCTPPLFFMSFLKILWLFFFISFLV